LARQSSDEREAEAVTRTRRRSIDPFGSDVALLDETQVCTRMRMPLDPESAARGVLKGVGEQVAEKDEKDFLVAVDGCIRRYVEGDLLSVMRKELSLILDHLAQSVGEGLGIAVRAGSFFARHHEEGLCQAFEAPGRSFQSLEPGARFGLIDDLFTEQIERPLQDGQGRSELMTAFRDEPALPLESTPLAGPGIVESTRQHPDVIPRKSFGQRAALRVMIADLHRELDDGSHRRSGEPGAREQGDREHSQADSRQPALESRDSPFGVLERGEIDETPLECSGRT
jgi:hypothetical protein